MAVQKIEYEDKEALKNDLTKPRKNKVVNEDMNEIKNVVNNNADELSAVKQNIENLQEGQGTANTDITDLKNRVSTLETDNTKNKQDIENKVNKIEGKGLSTEDYTTAEKTKLALLTNYDDTEIKEDIEQTQTDIELIQQEQAKQNIQIQKNQDNYIHIETEQSNTINVQDCSNLPAKIDIFGSSEQKTRSGKNKFDATKLSNIKDVNSKISSFTFEKMWTKTIMGNMNLQKLLKPNTQYKCLAKVTLLNKPDSLSSANSNQILSLYNSSEVKIIDILTTSSKEEKNNWQLNETKTLKTSFTTDVTLEGYNLIAYNYLTEQSANEGSFKIENIMILESTEQDESFEQYGASPSPIFPSKIENVEGNIDIMKCNKNLFDGIFSQGYDSNGNITSSNQFVCNTNLINVEENESYTISNNLNLKIVSIAYYKDNIFTGFQSNMNLATITIPQNVNQIRFNLYREPTLNVSNFAFFQFERNTTATNYIEHEEQIITFPLEEGQKMYEGSYSADDGIHHKRKQIELDGTENIKIFNWSTPHEKTTMFSVSNIISKKTDSIKLCNYFKVVKNTVENLNKDEEYCLSDITGAIHFSISNEIATTVEQFENWLAQKKQEGKPLIVEYDLLEEEIEEYTEEQQEANQLQNVIPYKLVTNISTEKAGLVFKYIADTKTYIDNKYNSLAKQLLNLQQ